MLDLRPVAMVVFGLFVLVGAPSLVRRGLAKAFRSNKRIQEELRFTFTAEATA